MSSRREFTLVVLGCLAGAGLALFAATRAWAVEVTLRPAPLPPLHTPRTGAALLPWLPALAVVALAGAGALPATRRAGRTAVGVLLLAAGLGIVAGGGFGLAGDGSAVWPGLCLGGGVAVTAAAAGAVLRGRRWPAMGGRYERPGRATRSRPRTASELWDALDRGEDPTADEVVDRRAAS
ncbi:MAG: Trp biosynthesis-associated membrane protein [Micromonosporaceae bacterium]